MARLRDGGRYYAQVREGCEWINRSISTSVLPTKERAVCDDIAAGGTVRFCKIHHVLEDGKVFVDALPADGSPLESFSKNPHLAKHAMATVFMGQVQFQKAGKTSTFQVTFFDAAPGYAITAGHNVNEYEDKEWLGDFISIKGARGAFVPDVVLRKGDSCTLVAFKDDMVSQGGLPTRKGADVAVVKVGDAKRFLLPCSPAMGMKVSVFSYPAVSAFMEDAGKQLLQGKPPLPGCPSIWELYRETMAAHGVESEEQLYKLLNDAFQGFTTGQKVASPGKIVLLGNNFVGACYTTLAGSCGGPICVIESPDFYCGIHVAGSEGGYDLNIGTSCDNPDFVKMFKDHLLDKLPGPENLVWETFGSLKPFLDWLEKHGISWERPRMKKRAWTHQQPDQQESAYSPASPSTTFPVGLDSKVGQEVLDAEFCPVS